MSAASMFNKLEVQPPDREVKVDVVPILGDCFFFGGVCAALLLLVHRGGVTKNRSASDARWRWSGEIAESATPAAASKRRRRPY